MAAKIPTNKPQPLEQMARLPRSVRALILLGVSLALICVYYFSLYPSVESKLEGLDGYCQVFTLELGVRNVSDFSTLSSSPLIHRTVQPASGD